MGVFFRNRVASMARCRNGLRDSRRTSKAASYPEITVNQYLNADTQRVGLLRFSSNPSRCVNSVEMD